MVVLHHGIQHGAIPHWGSTRLRHRAALQSNHRPGAPPQGGGGPFTRFKFGKELPAKKMSLLFLISLDHLHPFSHNSRPLFIRQNPKKKPKTVPWYTNTSYYSQCQTHWLMVPRLSGTNLVHKCEQGGGVPETTAVAATLHHLPFSVSLRPGSGAEGAPWV